MSTAMFSAYDWFSWALLSAVFAALTAIFAKLGLEGIDSDFATLVRTVVILVTLRGFVSFAGKWSNPFALQAEELALFGVVRAGHGGVVGLLLSRVAGRGCLEGRAGGQIESPARGRLRHCFSTSVRR